LRVMDDGPCDFLKFTKLGFGGVGQEQLTVQISMWLYLTLSYSKCRKCRSTRSRGELRKLHYTQ